MKVMMSVMIESKNDDDFCDGSSGSGDRAVDIHAVALGFQYKIDQLQSIKLESPHTKP
jgi:hypothetical protein